MKEVTFVRAAFKVADNSLLAAYQELNKMIQETIKQGDWDMTDNQKGILRYLQEHGQATKQQLYEASGYGYFRNWQKHFGDVLTRMVRQGYIARVKQGVYEICKNKKQTVDVHTNPNQQELF